MRIQGLVYCWIGLMGLAATGGVFLLLRAFPRAFVESGPAAVWPWRSGARGVARIRGVLLLGAGAASLAVAIAGIVSFIF
jgi:hypothetical protein